MINTKKNFFSLGLLCVLLGWTGVVSAYGYPIHDRMNTFYQAGYHVITISSPTKPPFMAAASSTNLPGLTNYDAEDLYRVMTHALDVVSKEIEITEKYVTGYSLGGIESAFVGYLDSQRKEINFDKVLMINPPVNLYEGDRFHWYSGSPIQG